MSRSFVQWPLATISIAAVVVGALGACAPAPETGDGDPSALISAAAGRFDPGSETRTKGAFNATNAAWLGRVALWVYENRDDQLQAATELKAAVKQLDGDDLVLQNYRFFEADGDTEAAYVATNRVAILAFRGTESVTDLWTDLAFSQVRGIHHGVLAAWEGVWTGTKLRGDNKEGIRALLLEEHQKHPDLPLYITGHSLGGALATVAVQGALSDGIPVTALYTFGSPRVGNEAFANEVATLARDRGTYIYRVVNQGDGVTELPKWGFKHIALTGEEELEGNSRVIFLGKKYGESYVGTAHGEQGFWTRLMGYLADLMAHDILHHPMDFYLCKLDRLTKLDAPCPELTERAASATCNEVAKLFGEVIAQNQCGSYAEATEGFAAAAGCNSVVRIRDEQALRSVCMPSLRATTCGDLENGRLDPSCMQQFLQE
jgi:hypothetical protein